MLPGWVRRYVGLPWLKHGRGLAGVDCYGLIRLVLEEQFGLVLPSYAEDYADPEDAKEVSRLIRGKLGPPWLPVPRGSERCCDAIILRLWGQDCHIGLVVAPGRMLHIERMIDSALDRYDTPLWANRIEGFYRHERLAAA